ncbi:MAG TPA: lamin tail domain-containing protein, partial [Flavobacteriales bacterium]|nr:lamin tail domain-containing protein [Flavobacteriales bacterium]
GLPEPVAVGDVVINEVLYDPRGSGSDFVELYNRSSKVLSLAGWKLANVEDGVIDNATVITSASFLFMPGTYVAIMEDSVSIIANYPLGHSDRYLQADMPSYNNGEGTVVLLAADDDTLDLFTYNDDLHFELLNETDGVSLERVDPARPASDNSNWHSAAETVGWATPGYQNSQYAPAVEASGAITIEPAIFSPDNDGYQDLLSISYRFDEPGFVGTMKVFDIAGREVRTLMDSQLLGTSGAVSWDGIMDTKDLARIGPYVVYFEAYDLNGNVEKFRETVVLAHRLD